MRTYLAPMLPEAELDALLADGVQVKNYGGGEILFREGDPPDGLYLLKRGSVTISRTIAGREVVLSYLSAGNYVGEMALLTDSARTATVKAAVTTEALVLNSAAFKLAAIDPGRRRPSLWSWLVLGWARSPAWSPA